MFRIIWCPVGHIASAVEHKTCKMRTQACGGSRTEGGRGGSVLVLKLQQSASSAAAAARINLLLVDCSSSEVGPGRPPSQGRGCWCRSHVWSHDAARPVMASIRPAASWSEAAVRWRRGTCSGDCRVTTDCSQCTLATNYADVLYATGRCTAVYTQWPQQQQRKQRLATGRHVIYGSVTALRSVGKLTAI